MRLAGVWNEGQCTYTYQPRGTDTLVGSPAELERPQKAIDRLYVLRVSYTQLEIADDVREFFRSVATGVRRIQHSYKKDVESSNLIGQRG
jgi:hypothetical protein